MHDCVTGLTFVKMAEPLQLDNDKLTPEVSGSSSIPAASALTKTKMAAPSSQSRTEASTVTTESTRRGKGSSKIGLSSKGKQKLSKKVEFVEKEEFDRFREEVLDMKSMLKDFIVANSQHSETEQKEAQKEAEDDEEEGLVEEDDTMAYFENIAGMSECKGPRINDTLAAGVTKILREGLNSEGREALLNKYSTPENCERLRVVPCNEAIYKGMRKQVRLVDKELQNVQSDLTKGLMAGVYAFNEFQSASPQAMNEHMKSFTDSLSLIANASHKLDIFRRGQFKPELNADYASLCTVSRPVEETLFGQLSEDVKECVETARLTKKVNEKRATQRYQPYKKPYHFLGFRGSNPRRGGGSRYYTSNSSRSFNNANQNKSKLDFKKNQRR